MGEARNMASAVCGLSVCVLGFAALRISGILNDGDDASLTQLLLFGPLYAMGHYLGRYIVGEVERSERRKD